jgi:hypothetical protein
MSVAAIAIVSAALAGAPPHAVESRGGPGVLSGNETLRVEYAGDNDSLGFGVFLADDGFPYDRWVTSSNQLRVRGLALPATHIALGARVLVEAELSQNIYTPRTAHVLSIAELRGDRPYSGWLSLGLGAEAVVPRAPIALTLGPARPYTHAGVDVYAGLLGPWSLAGPVQHHAHFEWMRLRGLELPPVEGWGVAETAPGAALDVTAFLDTSLLSAAVPTPAFAQPLAALEVFAGRPALDLRAGLRADVGSTLDAGAANTTLALGWLGDPLGADPALVPIAAYVFVRGEVRAVAWNAAIDAPLLDGTRAARSTPGVAEGAVGAVLRLWLVEASFATVYRSNEVKTLPGQLQTGQVMWRFGGAVVF